VSLRDALADCGVPPLIRLPPISRCENNPAPAPRARAG
jgi:hypothetical protein